MGGGPDPRTFDPVIVGVRLVLSANERADGARIHVFRFAANAVTRNQE